MRRSKIVEQTVNIIESKKGEDIIVYDVRNKNPFFDYVIICTCLNEKNGNAIVDAIEEEYEKINHEIKNVEGKNGTKWMIVDGGDIIVHIFEENERRRINLEKILNKSHW